MKKLYSLIYALCFEVIVLPILGFITYYIFDSLYFLNVIHNSFILSFLVIFLLAALNIAVLYGAAMIFNKKIKMDLIYFIVSGLIFLFVALWFLVYYYTIFRTNCGTPYGVDCALSLKNSKMFITFEVMGVSYYLMYIVFHKLIAKKTYKKEK